MRYDRNHTWVSRLESSSHLFLFIFSILSDLLFELVRLALSTFSDVCIISRVPYTSGPVNECAVFVGQRTHSSYLPLRWPLKGVEVKNWQYSALQSTHSNIGKSRIPTYGFQHCCHSALRPTHSNKGNTAHSDLRSPTLATQFAYQHKEEDAYRERGAHHHHISPSCLLM